MRQVNKIMASLFVFSILGIQITAAQFSKVEMDAGIISNRVVDPFIEQLLASGNFLKRSAVNGQLAATLNKKISISRVAPAKKELNGEQMYRRVKASTIAVFSRALKATGYLIDGSGICVTNYHVLKMYADTSKKDFPLFVMTADEKLYPVVEILACSQVNDIAIIRIATNNDRLVPLAFAKTANEGTDVYVMGHPAHMLYYFSKGIVARNFINNPDALGNGEQARMAITADYSLGESGGPIVNNRGNLVGMVSAAQVLYGNVQTNTNPQMVVKSAIPVLAVQQLIE